MSDLLNYTETLNRCIQEARGLPENLRVPVVEVYDLAMCIHEQQETKIRELLTPLRGEVDLAMRGFDPSELMSLVSDIKGKLHQL